MTADAAEVPAEIQRRPLLTARRLGTDSVSHVGHHRRSQTARAGNQALRVLVLVVLVLPLCAQGAVNVDILGIQGDFTWTQLVVLGGSTALLLAHGGVARSRFLAAMATAWLVVVGYDVLVTMFGEDRFAGAALRGVLNASTNLLVAAAMSTVFAGPGQAQVAVRAVSGFGFLLAMSALFEYALLKLAPGMLLTWRGFVTRGVDVDALLSQGGVSLTTEGLARVGGVAGAPEVCGFLLSLSLPFVLLRGGSRRTQTAIIVAYALAAVVTGSRTLGIALVVTAFVTAKSGMRHVNRARRSILFALALAVIVVAVAGVNREVLQRVGGDAWRYELDWRLERLTNLAVATQLYPMERLFGCALGYGVDLVLGLPPVTAGLIGGDFSIATTHGGVVGLMLLAILWWGLLGVRRDCSKFPTLRSPVRLYLVIVGSLSLVTPVLVQLIFVSSVFTVFLVGFPLAVEALARQRERALTVAKYAVAEAA